MNSTAQSALLRNSPENIQTIRKCFDLDKPGKMDEAVAILQEWIGKQNHFMKKEFRRNFLEMLIIQSKGSLERAKSRLDKYCTLKTMMPQYFYETNPKLDFKEMHEAFHCAVLPKLVDDCYRLCLVKAYKQNINPKSVVDFYKITLMITEYALAYDYFTGAIVVFDYLDTDLNKLVASLNPIEMGEVLKLQMECFGVRLKGIHFVTPSVLVQGVVTILRQLVSKKIGQRIHVHKNLDSLFYMLPREAFPQEYGGRERSLVAIRDDWLDSLESDEYVKYRQEMKQATTNEERRDTYEFNSIYMGLPGTFRYMKVD